MPHRPSVVPPLPVDRAKLHFDIAFQVVLASRRFRARFAERVKSRGQTDSRWSALYMLSQHAGGLIQSELAELMGVQGPTLVRLLDALQEQGLVSRHPAPGDRRANRIAIEPAGRQVLEEIDIVAARLREEVLGKIPDTDLQVTLRSLEVLAKNLERVRS